MSLNFAGLAPHPPLLVPEIGQEDTIKVKKTVDALEKLATIFGDAEIETLIVISPHSLVYPDRFNISTMEKNSGSFAQFGHPEITFNYKNDTELVYKIAEACQKENIPFVPYDNGEESFEMDHGIMVPLYYLQKEKEMGLKIIPIAYSGLTRAQHFAFGQLLGEVCQKYAGRVGIMASGDLSHRLIYGAPENTPEAGQDFDEQIINDLEKYNVKDILYYEDDFVENAGECGYRSILILLGALDNIHVKPELLSYEGPFGVGYAVVNFNLPEN